METVGIICEYNPLHNGHVRQLRLARQAVGAGCAIICLMSGNYVQRGVPAIYPKQVRAEAALRCGADLVLELPLTVAVSSAEGFAAGGVSILSALGCDRLCFGTESEDFEAMMQTARANLSPDFDALLRAEMETGCSYPLARQRALTVLGAGAGLNSPNDILAVEYCKAMLRQGSGMLPLPVRRTGSYHAQALDPEAPSATALRAALAENGDAWRAAVPPEAQACYEKSPIHTWAAGERAVLARVRALPKEAFLALPFGTEGLWSKLMKSCRSCASTEEIIEAAKSKRYPRSRIQRMLLCAYLGLTKIDLETPPPYVRILGFGDKGRSLLREWKGRFPLIHAGERPQAQSYYSLERCAANLYSLFSAAPSTPAGTEETLRVVCLDLQKCGLNRFRKNSGNLPTNMI